MKPITSILAITDFSGDGNDAVRRAALLAHEHDAVLKIMHVPTTRRPLREWLLPSSSIDLRAAQARASLRDLALEITGRHDVAVTAEVGAGQPVEALLQAARQADLVVVGGRRARLTGWLEGRALSRVLSSGGRPVLTVKASVDTSYRRGIVPIDFTASSDAAIRAAAGLLGESRLHLFHAINAHEIGVLRHLDIPAHVVRDHRQRQKAGAVARMRGRAAQLGLNGTRMGFAADHGHPVWSALRQAAALGADLIVAGTQARSALSGLLLGSVSRRLMSESVCDVLVVPPAREADPARRPRSRPRGAGPAGAAWRLAQRRAA